MNLNSVNGGNYSQGFNAAVMINGFNYCAENISAVSKSGIANPGGRGGDFWQGFTTAAMITGLNHMGDIMDKVYTNEDSKVDYSVDKYINGDLKEGISPGKINFKKSSKTERVTHLLKWVAYSNRDGGKGVITFEDAYSNIDASSAHTKLGGYAIDYFNKFNPLNVYINGKVYKLSINVAMFFNWKAQLTSKTLDSSFGSDGLRSQGWTYNTNRDLTIGSPSTDYGDILKYIFNYK